MGLAARGNAGGLGEGGGNALIGRAFDLAIAVLALVLTGPVLLAAIVAIRVETPGSPIYRNRGDAKTAKRLNCTRFGRLGPEAEAYGRGFA